MHSTISAERQKNKYVESGRRIIIKTVHFAGFYDQELFQYVLFRIKVDLQGVSSEALVKFGH